MAKSLKLLPVIVACETSEELQYVKETLDMYAFEYDHGVEFDRFSPNIFLVNTNTQKATFFQDQEDVEAIVGIYKVYKSTEFEQYLELVDIHPVLN